MSTTTLRLPEELKARLARLAETAGSSPHALMVELLAESADLREARADFAAEAERRWKKLLRTGEYLNLDDVRSHVAALARGERPDRPAPRRMNAEEIARLRASARRLGDA